MDSTERAVLDALNWRYGKTYTNGDHTMNRYTRAEHVRSSLGFDARRTCDYIALDLWGSQYGSKPGPFLHGHEVKCSRADWLVELKHPEKAEAFRPFMHHWWLVVSDAAFVHEGELPEGWGLLVGSGNRLRSKVTAPRLVPAVMSPNQYGALLRATARTSTHLAALAADR